MTKIPETRNPETPNPVTPKNSSADAFLREVDDAVRKSDLEGFMRRFGWWVAGLLALVIAGWGGFILWQQNQVKEAGKVAESFLDAADDSQSGDKTREKAALTSFDMLAKQGSEGYGDAAKIAKANLLLKQGDAKGAAALYGEVAANTNAAQPLRDLALVRQTLAEFDNMKPQAVIDRLAPLTSQSTGFSGTAGEMTAISLLKLGKKKEAGALFKRIALNEKLPPSLRSRAQLQAGSLGLDVDISPKDDEDKKAE